MDRSASGRPEIPGDGLDRLRFWQERRTRDEERERVEAALAKDPEERTAQDERVIAHSPFGTGRACNC
jgi:hypothetical protein